MKKKLLLFSFVMLLLSLFIFPTSVIEVSALTVGEQVLQAVEDGVDTETGEIVDEDAAIGGDDNSDGDVLFDGVALSKSQISDENLYSALLKTYKFAYSGTDRAYTGSTIYSDMFKDMKTINLDSSQTKLTITSLAGLEYLDFDSLESFSANLNSITTFDPVYFQNTNPEKFSSLSLAGNQLESIPLDGLTGLYNINLSSNKLTKIDFGKIEGEQGGNTIVSFNLAGNTIENMSDINLPSRRIGHINLNIIGNNITSIEDKFFTEKYTLQVGIQGFNKAEEIVSVDTKQNLVVYQTGIENLSVIVYKIDGDFDDPVATIDTQMIEGGFTSLNLGVGEYEYEYVINGSSAYSKNDIDRRYLASQKFNVIPQAVAYTFTFKGKEYTELEKVTGVVTVNLKSDEEGARIYYSINGSDWIEGTEVLCDKGGNYNIKVKSVIGQYESKEQEIWVKTSLNLIIPDALMLVLVLLLAITLFFVVVPIVSKKYFKKD